MAERIRDAIFTSSQRCAGRDFCVLETPLAPLRWTFPLQRDMNRFSPLRLIAGSALLYAAGAGVPHALAQNPAQGMSVAEIARRSTASVVTIRTYDAGGRELGIGSGFVIEGGRVVTNSHVVEGADRAEVFTAEGQLVLAAQYAEVLSTRVDLAILPASPLLLDAPLPLGRTPPAVGDPVVVIGAPRGLTATVTNGIVSAWREVDGVRLLQTSAAISPGSSGGPVFNMAGEVIGVSVASFRDSQNLNFAVPVADLIALAASPLGRFAFPQPTFAGRGGPENPPTAANSPPRELPVVALGALRHFRIEMHGCANDRGLTACIMTAHNDDSSRRETGRVYVMGANLLVDGISLRSTRGAVDDRERSFGTFSFLEANIGYRESQQFLVYFSGVSRAADQATLRAEFSVGFTGGTHPVEFLDIPLIQMTQ